MAKPKNWTYDPDTEITNCCGAPVTWSAGIICKKCWHIVQPVDKQGHVLP